MTEIQSITGDALYCVEYTENIMKAYGEFYKGLKEYKKDEYLDMLWLPDPKDIYINTIRKIQCIHYFSLN